MAADDLSNSQAIPLWLDCDTGTFCHRQAAAFKLMVPKVTMYDIPQDFSS